MEQFEMGVGDASLGCKGPLDGSVLGIPDKRLDRIHTVYRDEHGPVLALDTFTNGPKESTWDAWVKAKPKPLEDTRNGRAFFAKEGSRNEATDNPNPSPQLPRHSREHCLQCVRVDESG
eukprot:4221333-Amphidinium_carterae.1